MANGIVRSPTGPGSVVGDTHAAQLNGVYNPSMDSYTPEIDSYTPETHGYVPSNHNHTPSSHTYNPSSDSHALGGSLSQTTSQNGANGSVLGDGTDRTMVSVGVTTTANTKHVVIAISAYGTNSITLKIKRGATLLASMTSTSGVNTLSADDTGFSVGAQTYSLVLNAVVTVTWTSSISAVMIDDSHALTGSYVASSDSYTPDSDSYTPETHNYVASVHSNTPSSHSYTPSNDNHNATLIGSEGSCQL